MSYQRASDEPEGAGTAIIERVSADGGRIIGAANNAGDFINMLEEGQLTVDLHRELGDLAEVMSDMAIATGKKQKGKLTLVVDFTTEQIAGGQVFMATSKFAVKKPEEKRKATLLYTDDANRFTRSQPRQGQFFGVRDIDAAPGSVREVRG